MNLAIFFYLADILENLSQGLTIIFTAWAVAFVMALIFFPVWQDMVDDFTLPKKGFKWSIIGLPSLLLVASFLPSKSTMYTMAAAYGVQSVAENPNVQRVAGKSLQVLEDKLDEYLKTEKKVE